MKIRWVLYGRYEYGSSTRYRPLNCVGGMSTQCAYEWAAETPTLLSRDDAETHLANICLRLGSMSFKIVPRRVP